jgi:hypothetical protein
MQLRNVPTLFFFLFGYASLVSSDNQYWEETPKKSDEVNIYYLLYKPLIDRMNREKKNKKTFQYWCSDDLSSEESLLNKIKKGESQSGPSIELTLNNKGKNKTALFFQKKSFWRLSFAAFFSALYYGAARNNFSRFTKCIDYFNWVGAFAQAACGLKQDPLVLSRVSTLFITLYLFDISSLYEGKSVNTDNQESGSILRNIGRRLLTHDLTLFCPLILFTCGGYFVCWKEQSLSQAFSSVVSCHFEEYLLGRRLLYCLTYLGFWFCKKAFKKK